MASDILGLFGGVSPQQMQNQYLDQQMVSPAQLGAQGLLQQVVSLGGNAGSMLGYGAGRLLGGKVAGEVEATTINDAIKYASSKGNTAADKMEAVAEYLADKPGMGAQYMKAMQEAKKLRQEQNVIDREEGARKAVAALPPNASAEDVMTALQPFASTSEILDFKQKREAAASNAQSELAKMLAEREKYKPGSFGYNVYTKKIEKEFATKVDKDPSVGTKAELYAQTNFLKPFSQLTQEERATVLKDIESKDGVSLGDGLSKLAAAIGAQAISKEQAVQTAKAITPELVQGKENALNALLGAKELLGTKDNQTIYTGGLADLKKGISKYTPLGSQKKLENTEMFQQRVRTTVIPLLQAFGGNDTDEERKFLEKLQGGEITEEWTTLNDILGRAIDNIRRGIERDKNTYKNIVEGKGGVDISIKEDVTTQQISLPDGTIVTVRKKKSGD